MAEYKGRRGIVQVFSGITLLPGLWLIIAPWLLGYDLVAAPKWNDVLVGAAVLVLAGVSLILPARYRAISRINMTLGAWLIIAPFVLPYGEGAVVSNVAFWNDLVLGIVIITSAWLSAETTRRISSLGNE